MNTLDKNSQKKEIYKKPSLNIKEFYMGPNLDESTE